MKTDPIITKARQELADLEAKRIEIEAFIARYSMYKSGTDLSFPDEVLLKATKRKSPPADLVMSAVHDILTERKDALTLAAIFDALTERGVIVGGRNPKQNLSQKLSAHPQIRSYGKRGWYFADTTPPCLMPPRRLSEDDFEYDEGPATEVTRPCLSNGAASAN